MKTVQSNLKFEKNKVTKIYNRSFKFYDKKNFDSEVKVLNHFKESAFCINAWDFNQDGYTMERLDFDLGDDRKLNERRMRRVFFSLRITDVLNMLEGMKADLELYGIRHRDINPGNILWSEKERKLKLTDFFWADMTDNEVHIPGAVNQIYTTDDAVAIEKIRNEIIDVYEKMKPELEKIHKDFSLVGKNVKVTGRGRHAIVSGEYKDGSSLHGGKAYHVVDIPYFKDKIPCHKNTCIDEYKLIKKNLSMEPKSVLDIGCSAGYQLFNFIKDFKLDLAFGYENDPAVLSFLQSVKNVYSLKEAKFEQTFTDKSSLEKFDVTIWINAHMWVYKQLGKDRALEAVRNVIKNSKCLFFQTAGDYSSSIYKVTEYKNAEDVKAMLISAGARSVKQLKTFIGMHGAPRDMFLVEGGK